MVLSYEVSPTSPLTPFFKDRITSPSLHTSGNDLRQRDENYNASGEIKDD